MAGDMMDLQGVGMDAVGLMDPKSFLKWDF